MPTLYYDPVTWEPVPDLSLYTIERYNRSSFQVVRIDSGHSYILDFEDREGAWSCTCGHYLMKVDEVSETASCKHIRMMRAAYRHILPEKMSGTYRFRNTRAHRKPPQISLVAA